MAMADGYEGELSEDVSPDSMSGTSDFTERPLDRAEAIAAGFPCCSTEHYEQELARNR
jgi:hypothetical protein